MMKTITFTEFRKNASRFVSDVEEGEIIVILRHGRPVVEMKPITQETAVPAWKNPGLRLAVKGVSLSAAIIEEREREDIL